MRNEKVELIIEFIMTIIIIILVTFALEGKEELEKEKVILEEKIMKLEIENDNLKDTNDRLLREAK